MNKELGIFPVYTGSGADYITPNLQYVFSGEGNIAFGYGLYASSNKDVALWYMNRFGIGKIHVNWLLGDWNKIDSDINKLLSPLEKFEFIRYKNKLLNKLDPSMYPTKEDLKLEYDKVVKLLNNEYNSDRSKVNELLFKYFESLRSSAIIYKDEDHYNLYEQRFWYNKIPDLIDWHRPITISQMNKVRIQLLKENLDLTWSTEYGNFKTISELIETQGYLYGRELYRIISDHYKEYPYKNASLFLLRAGIDGVRYPIGTLGTGLGLKSGWNYVSFSDNNIEVVHHWKNGELVK